MKEGKLMQETYVNRIYAQPVGGHLLSAIQVTTAGAACAVLDMLAHGKLPDVGFIRQEDIPLADFLANRFGRVYAPEDEARRSA
jgi:saccharopine dehydrogenase-like NADP-dependent oxidoreductase